MRASFRAHIKARFKVRINKTHEMHIKVGDMVRDRALGRELIYGWVFWGHSSLSSGYLQDFECALKYE